MRERLVEASKHLREYLSAFVRWLLLGLAVGIISGIIGAGFSKAIGFVTGLRMANGWLILLLPLGGLLSVGIYSLCKVDGIGTNRVLESVRTAKKVPYLLAPAIFSGACITHLLGGSAGREGAALQLGGSVASIIGRVLHLDEQTRHILTICGMGAFFSALFGTPVGACVFALEVVSVGHFYTSAFFPAIVSSVSAFYVATLFGVSPERFHFARLDGVEVNILWRVAVIAVAGAVVSIIFCRSVHLCEYYFEKIIHNPFLRILVGGLLIVGLTVAVGNQEYNGGGIEIIERIFHNNEVRYEAFLLKIIFTVITISAGFKGGEIVPTFYIGATLGASIGVALGLSPALGAAVGMAAMFSSVTNCPMATVVLCIELFDGNALIYCAVSAVTAYLLSGNSGLYTGQRLVYSKTDGKIINANAG